MKNDKNSLVNKTMKMKEAPKERLKKVCKILTDKFGDDVIKRKRKIKFPYNYTKKTRDK